MSLSLTVGFAAAILYGPAFAGIVAIGGVVISDFVISRRHWTRVVFNAGQLTLSAGLAALVYELLAVPGPVDLSHDALAILVAAVVFLLVNDTLVTVVISLSGRSFLHDWTASFREMGVLYVSMAPLGALLAFAYQDSRWNILYFPFLIFVIYNGFKLYANLQTETDNALVLLADTVDKRDEYTYAALAARGRVRRRDRPGARPAAQRDRPGGLGGARARPRQDRHRQPHPLQAGVADRRRAQGYHRPPRRRQRARRSVQHVPQGARLHPPPPRALGRPRLPRRPGRHPHPAGRAHHHRGRRLRRHDLGPALPRRAVARDRPDRTAPRRRAGSSTPTSSTCSWAVAGARRRPS